MPVAAAKGTKVYAFLTFHVRTGRLAAFCDACAELLSASTNDAGRVRIALHRELPWARSMSNEEFTLFMMEQTWACGADLEKHTCSPHAVKFNEAILKQRMLATEPSVSIFGEPLTTTQLAKLAAEASAQEAAEASLAGEEVRALGNSSSVAAMGPSQAQDQSLHSTRSSTPLQRADSRSSVLRASATLTLKK